MEAIFPTIAFKTALKIAIWVFFRALKSKSGYFLGFSKKVPTTFTSTLRLPPQGGLGSELSAFVGRNVITTPLNTNENIVKMNKLACVMEFVLSLNELDNTDNLEDKNLSNVLLRHHVTANGEFTSFEPVTQH